MQRLAQFGRKGAGVRRPSLLPWIVAFKAFKTIALSALGIGLLATRHADPDNVLDLLFRIALAVHVPLSSRLFDRALSLATNLTLGKQTALGVTALGYAILMGTEGVGLYLRKPWARWFTIAVTGSLIPVEVYEILREVHPVRVVVLLLNVAVVVYLARRKEAFL